VTDTVTVVALLNFFREPQITIYQLTESGVSLQATVKGTKYWKDEALN